MAAFTDRLELRMTPRLTGGIEQAADQLMTTRSEVVRRGVCELLERIGIDTTGAESSAKTTTEI